MFKASDILQTMQDSFDNKIRNDAKLQKIRKKIQNGANQAASQQYAIRSGQLLSETLKENITADLFAEGEELDAAELAGALIPMMEKNHGYVSTASSAVQKYMNKQAGLGLKPVEPEFDASAAKNIVGRMSNYDSFEDAEWMLGEPMVANSIGIADESLRENAEFQYKSGLKPKIIRTCESGACEWCQMLAGEYDYDEVRDRNNPVYQRHNNCACEITFDPGDSKVQDVRSEQGIESGARAKRIRRSIEADSDLERDGVDIQLFGSIGAKWKNYDILDPDTDEYYNFIEHSKIHNPETFAGYGTHTSLDPGVAEGLTEEYGGDPKKWRHRKGIGHIDVDGEDVLAEVHWFQEESAGKHKFKIKYWL